MKRRGYTAWTKTPGGSTYYLGVILLDLMLFMALLSPSGFSIIKPGGNTVLIGGATVCLLVILYMGAKRRERKYLGLDGPLEREVYEASISKKIIEEFVFPPVGVLIVTALMWIGVGGGVNKILVEKMIVLGSVLSLLTLLYPLAQHLFSYRFNKEDR